MYCIFIRIFCFMNNDKSSFQNINEVESYMSMIRDDVGQKRVVLKGNALIDGRYRLDESWAGGKHVEVMGYKLLLSLIARVNPRSAGLPTFTLTQKDIVNMDIGVGKKTVYRRFSDECLKLLSLRISITERCLSTGRVVDKDINFFESNEKHWVDDSRTVLEKVQFTFTDAIKPYLNNLGRDMPYTSYLHHYVKQLSTLYAIRLYELLRRFRSMREKKPVITRNVDLVDLRECFEIPATKYKNFSNLKSGVLDPSIKQINKLTDIRVEYKGVSGNKGKKIQVVQFYIYKNKIDSFDEDSQVEKSCLIPDNVDFDESLARRIFDVFSYDIQGNFNKVVELFIDYPLEILKESLSDFKFQSENNKITLKSSTKWAYFRGICHNKNKGLFESKGGSSGEDQGRDPTDRSWADGLNLDDDSPL